jgi:hypothetical protein
MTNKQYHISEVSEELYILLRWKSIAGGSGGWEDKRSLIGRKGKRKGKRKGGERRSI